MGEDELWRMMLTDKRHNGEGQIFEGPSYGVVLNKAYSYLLKELKRNRGIDT